MLYTTRLIRCVNATALVAALACAGEEPSRDQTPPAAVPVGASPQGIAIPGATAEDGQWLRAAKDYANTRYSSLNEINTTNVSKLTTAWTFSTGVFRGQEAGPLVVGSTMYVVTPYPNVLYALDLSQPGAPMKWKYTPQPASAAQGVACCDVVNRGGVYADGKIIYNTLDAHTVAVDAKTGREVWKTRVGEINNGETVTMAPIVVRDKVFVGNSGGEFGVRGWVTALDVASGRVVWRGYSTGPDSEVLIGKSFKPFYSQDRGKDLGVTTWPPDGWKTGGGTVWGFISYDAEQNVILYGTANPGPWNADQRPGDNKFTSGVFARDADTGEAKWYYQWNPHDIFDHDGVNENVLVDLPIDGRVRKTLLHPDRNGLLYVMDRVSGEVISATPYGFINSNFGVDMKTGKLIPNPEKTPKLGEVVRDICPTAPGAKDWNPSAFSPRTGLLYLPHNNLCMDFEAVEANYIAGTPYVGANVKMHAGRGGHRGEFTAWDPINKRPAWKLTEKYPLWSGALVTAGDVVFYGTMEGWFKALDAQTGKELWRTKLPSGIIGQPITYRGPDGKQYIAIMSGVGGWAGAIVAGNLDPRDSSSALGFVGAMTDLPQDTNKGGTLHVFALP